MKNQTRRSALYPIRAVLLLLVCSLLLTGCANSFYKGIGGQYTTCSAVRSDTDIFDLDNVTLEWHFSVSRRYDVVPETGEIILEPETPFDLYFCVDRETRFFIKRVEDAFDRKKYRCDTKDKHAEGFWETYTVPREVFVEEKGWFYFVIVRPATDEKAESIEWETLAIFYEKVGKNKVRLDTWGAVYPDDTREDFDFGIIY